MKYNTISEAGGIPGALQDLGEGTRTHSAPTLASSDHTRHQARLTQPMEAEMQGRARQLADARQVLIDTYQSNTQIIQEMRREILEGGRSGKPAVDLSDTDASMSAAAVTGPAHAHSKAVRLEALQADNQKMIRRFMFHCASQGLDSQLPTAWQIERLIDAFTKGELCVHEGNLVATVVNEIWSRLEQVPDSSNDVLADTMSSLMQSTVDLVSRCLKSSEDGGIETQLSSSLHRAYLEAYADELPPGLSASGNVAPVVSQRQSPLALCIDLTADDEYELEGHPNNDNTQHGYASGSCDATTRATLPCRPSMSRGPVRTSDPPYRFTQDFVGQYTEALLDRVRTIGTNEYACKSLENLYRKLQHMHCFHHGPPYLSGIHPRGSCY